MSLIKWLLAGFTPLYFGGGGGGATTSTNTTQNFSPEESARRTQVQDEAQRIYNASKDQISSAPYPGAAPVPLGADSLQAQNMLRSWAMGSGTQQAGQAADYSKFLMGDALKAETNPYLQSAMDAATRQVTQAYTDPGGVMSSIRTSSQQAGPSTRQGIAEGVAARGYLNTVGDVSSKMAYQNYNDALKAGTQALALAPSTMSLGQMPGLTISGIGQQNEIMEQMQRDYDANAKMWELNAPWAPLQNYANIVFGGSTAGTTSTSTGPGTSTNRAMAGLGGAAMGASIAPMLGMTGPVGAGIGLLMGLMG